MPQPFFPNSVVLAWAFYLALVSVTLVATYTDLRYMRIPNWLTVPALALGILFNVVLGAWSSSDPARGSFLLNSGGGGFVGAVDGFLMSLCGFLVGMGLFVVMWMMGTCGAGDVKLFGAIGAWVGPMLAVFLLIGTVVFVVTWLIARVIFGIFSRGARDTSRRFFAGWVRPIKQLKSGPLDPRKTSRPLVRFSPAVALSVVLIHLWTCGVELHLRQPKTQSGAAAQTAQR